MEPSQLKFLRRMQAMQRALAGASRRLPFIYIDFVLEEAFMNGRPVSVTAATRAVEGLTDEQFRRAAQRCVVMVILVMPAEESPWQSDHESGYLDPRFAALPRSPVIVMYSGLGRAARRDRPA